MYHTSIKHLVWRAMVSKTLDLKATPDEQQKNINKAAEKLMNLYPPKN